MEGRTPNTVDYAQTSGPKSATFAIASLFCSLSLLMPALFYGALHVRLDVVAGIVGLMCYVFLPWAGFLLAIVALVIDENRMFARLSLAASVFLPAVFIFFAR